MVPGDGKAGAALTSHPLIAGVAFTGSTDTARAINRSLANRDGPIVPLIAETGGQNAMIVDSSALARAGDARRRRLVLPERGPALLGACASCSSRMMSRIRCWK